MDLHKHAVDMYVVYLQLVRCAFVVSDRKLSLKWYRLDRALLDSPCSIEDGCLCRLQLLDHTIIAA